MSERLVAWLAAAFWDLMIGALVPLHAVLLMPGWRRMLLPLYAAVPGGIAALVAARSVRPDRRASSFAGDPFPRRVASTRPALFRRIWESIGAVLTIWLSFAIVAPFSVPEAAALLTILGLPLLWAAHRAVMRRHGGAGGSST